MAEPESNFREVAVYEPGVNGPHIVSLRYGTSGTEFWQLLKTHYLRVFGHGVEISEDAYCFYCCVATRAMYLVSFKKFTELLSIDRVQAEHHYRLAQMYFFGADLLCTDENQASVYQQAADFVICGLPIEQIGEFNTSYHLSRLEGWELILKLTHASRVETRDLVYVEIYEPYDLSYITVPAYKGRKLWDYLKEHVLTFHKGKDISDLHYLMTVWMYAMMDARNALFEGAPDLASFLEGFANVLVPPEETLMWEYLHSTLNAIPVEIKLSAIFWTCLPWASLIAEEWWYEHD